MNEFTKDELEFLKSAVRVHYMNNPPIKGSTYINVWAEMIRKLQKLIDAEDCEHKSTCTDTFTKCTDCKKILGY